MTHTMKLDKRGISQFQKIIFDWWKENKRDLPWRHTHDPYRILVSEVMLQQTQVSRVMPVYEVFLEKFPTVVSLANASVADVLRAWKGMGYNRRALYLKKTAQDVVQIYDGIFPTDHVLLQKLSGIGPYTAGAIEVFAYKKDVSMVDTNIRKIITHFFFDDVPQKEKIILEVAHKVVPTGKSWQWHQALMDYGALVMAKKKREKSVAQKVQIPFISSDRYYRGMILDDLREKSQKEILLKKKYISNFSLSVERITVILSKLKRDGLIEIISGVVSLPR